uniref:Cytochrome P450 2K1-like n=1 Tax=Gadus morhua TaxID=8049 RepID=A0A8C5AIF7_GADMO
SSLEHTLTMKAKGTEVEHPTLLVLFFFSSSRNQGQGRDPPGPRPLPLPLIGNLLSMDFMKPHITLWEFSKKYGNVFTVYFGPKKVVVLAGYKTVKQALVNNADEFGDREVFKIVDETTGGHGILFANGETWKEMRRFALTTLRDFGMGKKLSEEKIMEECQYLIEVMEQYKGKAFDTTKSMNYAVSNIISAIIYGSRFEYDDPKFTSMVNRANETIRLTGSPSVQIYNALPWLGKWFSSRRVMKNTVQNQADISKMTQSLKHTLVPEVCRGFVDAFLIRQQTLEESGNKNSYYTNMNLNVSIANLFNAGTDTTATTLRWGLLIMAKYPKIQVKVQEELSSMIGSRQVKVEDRKNLPYIDAVIHEIQRFTNIVPMSLPHITSQDVTFQGYFIKKGTVVYPLLTSVLWDETEWESPLSFNPSHFLDEDGKFVKRDAFMPFSAGRRACVGESLARMELFLFFAMLLQHFHFTPPPGVSEDDLDLTPVLGITLNPSPHLLCANSRV